MKVTGESDVGGQLEPSVEAPREVGGSWWAEPTEEYSLGLSANFLTGGSLLHLCETEISSDLSQFHE